MAVNGNFSLEDNQPGRERERERELQGLRCLKDTSPSVETPGALRKSELSI